VHALACQCAACVPKSISTLSSCPPPMFEIEIDCVGDGVLTG
jgi:hypothetical protein